MGQGLSIDVNHRQEGLGPARVLWPGPPVQPQYGQAPRMQPPPQQQQGWPQQQAGYPQGWPGPCQFPPQPPLPPDWCASRFYPKQPANFCPKQSAKQSASRRDPCAPAPRASASNGHKHHPGSPGWGQGSNQGWGQGPGLGLVAKAALYVKAYALIISARPLAQFNIFFCYVCCCWCRGGRQVSYY